MVHLPQRLKGRWELVTLALMLEFLHFSIWLDFGSLLSRASMLIHLGLFLMWQPVWRSDERISWQNTIIFFILTLASVIFLNRWLMFGWMLILSGFAGGRIIINSQERNTYILVLLYLTLELLLECTPRLFNITISGNYQYVFSYVLPLLPLIISALPINTKDPRLQSVDILHAFSTATLLGVLIFGSLLTMYLRGSDYLISLVQTLLVIALILFIISWLLSPKAGFSGLSQLWSRSLLNIGTPLEKWLNNLSNLSLQQQTPIEFLEVALEDLINLPWIVGVKWRTDGTPGQLGDITRHETEFKTANFNVCIYSKSWMGAALYLHSKLLIQLIDNFYIGKLRERQLTQQAHLKAIHETGARVTHDIKNLLQSLHAITSIIQYDQTSAETKSVSQRLLERQLPYFTQRLQMALDKLQAPGREKMEEIYLTDWWSDLHQRSAAANIEFVAEITDDVLIPEDLFNSAVENLLENLKEKSRMDSNLRITITLHSSPGMVSLQVKDNGKSINEVTVKNLLREPVDSDSGLGIGLYQVARLAQSAGYIFTLQSNTDGNVCFVLNNYRKEFLPAAKLVRN